MNHLTEVTSPTQDSTGCLFVRKLVVLQYTSYCNLGYLYSNL
ncbi:hypothetical protein SAMN05421740_101142 [Parapedobacter koreensis]|uniref:Uncharacterized protein n=1 Tax=Parapedobacter koreensis TaxID=332977 RepID=A0A1H7EZ10_9SPHI|nr:hypothetical protein SAMN05421740_101142 [Parapedobacter koreensis]